jgi:hypothetical protein
MTSAYLPQSLVHTMSCLACPGVVLSVKAIAARPASTFASVLQPVKSYAARSRAPCAQKRTAVRSKASTSRNLERAAPRLRCVRAAAAASFVHLPRVPINARAFSMICRRSVLDMQASTSSSASVPTQGSRNRPAQLSSSHHTSNTPCLSQSVPSCRRAWSIFRSPVETAGSLLAPDG